MDWVIFWATFLLTIAVSQWFLAAREARMWKSIAANYRSALDDMSDEQLVIGKYHIDLGEVSEGEAAMQFLDIIKEVRGNDETI